MNTQRLLQLIKKAAFAVVAVFALSASTVMAQNTWYVSSTSGNDSFDGTSANVVSGLVGPKLTINGALAVAGDGDTIVIEAGAYAEAINTGAYAKAGGDTANLDDITFQVTAAGLVTQATVTGNLTVSTDVNFAGGTGGVTLAGDIALNARTMTIESGKLTISGTRTITRVAGSIAGAAPTFATNTNVTYNAGASATVTAGLELPSNLGSGTLSVTQTSGTLAFPNAITANTYSLGGGSTMTFSGNVTVATGGGGITTAGTAKVNAGSVALNNNVLTVAVGTQFTASGTVTYKNNASATPIATSGTTTIANFFFDVVDNAAAPVVYTATINVAAGTASFGALTEDDADDVPVTAGNKVNGHIAVTTAGGTTLTFTGNVTTRGDINNGGTIALGSTTFSNSSAAPTALGTFTGNSSTLALTAVSDPALPAITAAGNVNITTAGASTLGAITSSAGSITVTGDQSSSGGWFNTALGAVTATAGSVTLTGDVSPAAVSASAGTISWTGMNNANGGGNFTAAGITITGGGTLTGNVTSTGNLTVNSGADIAGVLSVTGTATFGGATQLSAMGGGSSVGSLVVNGALTTAVNAGTLTVTGTTTINSSTGSVDLNGTTQFTLRGDVSGGQFTYTGTGSTVYLYTSNSTQSFTPGVNSAVYNLTVGGDLNRTVSLLQSVQVGNNLTIEDDTNFDLTNKLVRLTGGTNVVTLNDDAQIIATGNTGALSFEFNVANAGEPVGPEIVVTGAPVTAPSVSNIIVTNTNAAPEPLDIDNSIRITGVVSLVDGGVEVTAGTTTFSGDNAGISVNVAGTNTFFSGAGTIAGAYNLTYTGTTAGFAAASEFSASVRNLTVATTGAVTQPAGAVTIQGNATVNSGATLNADAAGLTVPGNLTVAGTLATGPVNLSGNGASHSITGTVSSALNFNHNSTLSGSTSNTVPATITGNVTIAASRAVTMTNMQQISAVTVNGSLTLGMADADGAGTADAELYGAMLVNDGGSLTLTTNVGANGTVTIGSGGATTSASLDLGGNTLDMLAAAFTAVDNSAGGNANLGSTGTIKLSVGGATLDGNGATAPSVNVAASTTVTDVVVSGTLTVNDGAAASTPTVTIAGGQTLWLSGNATLSDPDNVVFAGGTFETTGTTLTASSNVTFADLRINSATTTTFASSSSTARTFTANNYLHTKGGVDVGAQTLAIADGTPVYVDGTYAASSGYVAFTGASTFDTTEKVVSFPRLRVDGVLTIGLNDASADGATVTGTLWFNGGSIDTDSNLSGGTAPNTGDATFSVGDGATIYDQTAGASFTAPSSPTLGTGLTVRYGVSKTSGKELPSTLNTLRVDTGVALVFANTRTITTSTLDMNGTGSVQIDGGAAGSNSLTIADGGQLLISGNGGSGAGTGVIDTTQLTSGEFSYAGAYSIVFDGSATSQTGYWIGTPTAVTVNDGVNPGVSTLTLGANHTTGNLSAVGDDLIALGGNTLTVNGSITNGSAISGGTIAFAGSAAQTVDATGGLTLPNVIFNNAAGITISGGNLTITGTATFTAGPVMTGTNFVQLAHANTVGQGFTRTSGCVAGNVRKNVPGAGATADRIEFPTCAADGSYRPAAVTFNNPAQVGAGTFLTVGHVETAPGGNNNLPLTTTDDQGAALTIARYPAFHWTVTSSATLSPSVNYDVELRAAGYASFAGEDIERVRTIRRQGGASTNFWTLVGPTASSNDNFAVSATEPVAIVRSAQGAIISTPGTLFTMGLESNMAVTNPAAVSVNAGQTSTVDLSTVFSGGTGAYTYAITSGGATVATGAASGNTLTVTGVGAGSTTLTVVATDELNDTRTATVAVTVNPAFAAGTIAATALNAGGTSTVDLSTVFSGGAAPITYAVATSDAAAATGAEASGTLTITAVAAGSATITVTATDATAQTATATVAVTVNAAMAATNPAVVSLTEGASQDIDLSTVFAGGDGTYTYTVASAATNVTGAVSGSTLTVTAADAYAAGTTIGTVAVTVTATDGLGSSVSATVTVDVLPILGDLDGSGAPSAASASIALDYFLGINTTLTAKQIAAADFNMDGVVNAYDAALIFNAFLNGKDELAPNVAANLQFGAVEHVDGMVNIPLQLVGDLNDVVAASFTANIDPSKAKVVAVNSELDGEWIIKHTVSEEGQLRIAVAGLGVVPTDGTIATISVQLTDANAAFDLVAEGAVNNNAASALDAIEVVELPESFTLQGNYPNPFNPTTTIQFNLPASADVEVQVYDMVGRMVMTLPAQNIAAGANRSVQLNASQLASGSYFYRVIARMDSKTFVETGRMLLLK